MSHVHMEMRRTEVEPRGAIVIVGDDAQTGSAVLQRMKDQFGSNCEVLTAADSQEAGNLLKSLQGEKNLEVSVVAIAMHVVLDEPVSATIDEYVPSATRIVAYADAPVGQMRDQAITAGASDCVRTSDLETVVHDLLLEKELGELDFGFAPRFSFVT